MATNAGRPFGKADAPQADTPAQPLAADAGDQPGAGGAGGNPYHDELGRFTTADDAVMGDGKDDGTLGGAAPKSDQATSQGQGGNQPTEKMQQAVAGVNPENGHNNCVGIAEAVTKRINGDDPKASAADETDVNMYKAQDRLGTKFITTPSGVKGAYDRMQVTMTKIYGLLIFFCRQCSLFVLDNAREKFDIGAVPELRLQRVSVA